MYRYHALQYSEQLLLKSFIKNVKYSFPKERNLSLIFFCGGGGIFVKSARTPSTKIGVYIIHQAKMLYSD